MISVVIPAFNEEHTISACLKTLVEQRTNRKFEVIVVNNRSTDNTEKIVRKFIGQLDLMVISESHKSRGAARAVGFAKANAQIILSTDADSLVPENWVEFLATKLDNPKVVAVTGTMKIADCAKPVNMFVNMFQPFSMRIYRLIFGHYWLSGFSFGIKKDIYEQVGGFDRQLNVQEDIDLSFKVSRIGKIEFISNLPVKVSGRRFKSGLIKGFLPYITTFWQYFILGKKQVLLSDVR